MKEGDIYMYGKYHNPNDFWRQRMEPWEYDSLERKIIRFLKAIAVICAVGLLAWLLCGCRIWEHGTNESRDATDSVRIEYREKVVKVPVTVYVEVPVEKKVQMDRDSSHLETSFAVSDAKMVWIDGVLFLRHSLENKPKLIAKSDSVPVVEKEKIVWKTRRVTYTKKEIREKRLAWWQKGLMWTGGIACLIAIIYIVCIIVRQVARR